MMVERSNCLVGSDGERRIRQALSEDRLIVGRGADCGLRLTDRSVSRQHAEFSWQNGRLLLRDLGSANGTWVNDMRLEETTAIDLGDRIRFANAQFDILAADSPSRTVFTRAEAVRSDEEVSFDEVRALGRASTAAGKQVQLFQVLADAGELLAVTRRPEELLEPILDLVESALMPQRTFVLLLEEGNCQPVIKASRFKGSRSNQDMVLSTTMVERVLRDKASLLTTDALNDPRFEAKQSVLLQQIRSAMAAPLFDNEQVIGLLYADTSDPAHWFSRDELRAFTLLANVIAVAITHARYHAMEEEKVRLESELDTARQIVERILPAMLPAPAGYELSAFQESCYEVGGDLYTVMSLADGRLGLLICDVSGKGLGAALLVTNIIPVVQLLAEEAWEPARLMNRLNRQVWQATDTVHFATVFWGIIEPDTGRLEYVNAGHNHPFIVSPDGTLQPLPVGGLPVGMLEEFPYKAGEAQLAPGALLTLFSDGIPETINAQDEEFSEERLHELVVGERQQSPQQVIERVRAAIQEFRGEEPAADDVTILVIKRQAAAGPQ